MMYFKKLLLLTSATGVLALAGCSGGAEPTTAIRCDSANLEIDVTNTSDTTARYTIEYETTASDYTQNDKASTNDVKPGETVTVTVPVVEDQMTCRVLSTETFDQ